MMWRVVKKQYHQLSNDYIDIYRTFLTRAFKFSNNKSRQNVCLNQLNKHFSLPISRLYADRRFDPKSKKLVCVDNDDDADHSGDNDDDDDDDNDNDDDDNGVDNHDNDEN